MPSDLDPDLLFHFKAHARVFIDACDFNPSLPPPPAVANSIEGGRYRDELARVGTMDDQSMNAVITTAVEIVERVLSLGLDTSGPHKVPLTSIVGNLGQLITDIIRDVSQNPYCLPVKNIIMQNSRELDYELPKDRSSDTLWQDYFKDTPLKTLLMIDVSVSIPDDLRVEHHQIVAGSGHGKTQCIQSMILDDWETDAAMVVIDSQGDLINNLLAHAPLDRVVLIDPETCPPALNIFATKVRGEYELATTVELFEYIFSSLDVKLTGQQSLVYRYLSRLLLEIPGATIETMRDMLQVGGTEPYQEYIDKLGSNAKAFFSEFQKEKNNQYQETRQAVLRRLLMVLESETFSKMLSAPNMAFDFPKFLDEGKIILISTSKRLLKDGAFLFGRIFVALVMQAVMTRKASRRRTYLYIDEFADYAEDSRVLFDLFEQARKYELGMVICHQYLDQLPPQLRKSISANTAIKFAGGVSAEDARSLASQMQTKPEAIESQPKLTFSAWFKGTGAMTWTIEPGRMERTPRHDDVLLDVFRSHMRQEYGVVAAEPEPTTEEVEPEPEDIREERW